MTDTPKGRKRPAPEGRGTLSHQLRVILRDQGSTPYALAQQADIDPKTLGRFLAGSRGLSLATADRIAVSLGLRLGVELARSARKAKPKATRAKTV